MSDSLLPIGDDRVSRDENTNAENTNTGETQGDMAAVTISDAAEQAPVTGYHERVTLNVVAGKGKSFVSAYILLTVVFLFCVVLIVICAAAVVLACTAGEARLEDIGVFFKLIISFDFGNAILKSAGETKTDALIFAYVLAGGIALVITAVLAGVILGVIKKHKVTQRVVLALLPGRKRGFVPCVEGIYKLCYKNLWTKNRFYILYTWEFLSLYAVDERKKRILLSTGKILMPLIAWDRQNGLFEGLKAIIFTYLPEEKKRLPVKRQGYRWVRSITSLFIVFAVLALSAKWLKHSIDREAGNEYCDVGGNIHYSYKTAFATEVYYFVMRDNNGKVFNKFCELHGVIYVTLHPKTYVPTIKYLLQDNKASPSPVRSVMILEMLIFPAMVWLYLVFIILYSGRPVRSRFNVL